MNVNHFGEHITLDGYGGSSEKMNDEKLIFNVLDGLPEYLGMHPLSKPHVVFAPGNDKKDPGGWSGFILIQESHVSLHTFPRRGFISADVYTCQNGLDKNKVCNYFVKKFDLKKTEVNFIIRGTEYPKENIYK